MVEYETAKTPNVACPMSDGQAAFGVFLVEERRMLKTTGQLIRQCVLSHVT